MGLSLAREIAFDTFAQVMNGGKKPEDVLDEKYSQHEKRLKRLDRNFIKEIVYGSLRWHSKLFWILQHTSKRDLNKSSPEIKAALVVGVYQIYYLDRVPDRAAVNESVEYIRKKGQANACSFVNGILRQIARRAEYFAKPDKKTKPVEYLSLQFAHPEWLIRRWHKRFKFERLESMLAESNLPPPTSIRINQAKIAYSDSGELQDRLLKEEKTHSERRPLRSSIRLKETPNLSESSIFAEGYYTIQDESSQLIAFLVDPKDGETIVDACSGPGGKLSHIYELAHGKTKLVSVEKDESQLQKAQDNMKRLGHETVEWVHGDFSAWSESLDQKVDKILLDSPCTGLGVLRRHPEGKWQKDPSSIPKLVKVQETLINSAMGCLKVGGELIYSVCSFEPEEAEHHLDRLVKEFGDKIEVISPVSRLPDYFKKYVTRKNCLSVFAGNQDGMDGFSAFVVRLKDEI
ncbi:MAG: 16S rRNA (cytosine(967)-C(5))-methyltransferase RsmB [Pseudobacteriovorax sp.]|nr:16S rRNA (cytosine(967)-C(5))-methyltransferase RsmB [Pseudobacteriovorax sp.]